MLSWVAQYTDLRLYRQAMQAQRQVACLNLHILLYHTLLYTYTYTFIPR